ncbi:MAG: endonuclease III [Candidatus Micrarchaeota archaeon]|nr:endonuclease III [Candidatus Micrarchaeota archaeon]
MKSRKTVLKIISLLKKEYPDEFNGSNISEEPFKVLIGTVLSHQTRDERTIMASRNLFRKFDTPDRLANASVKEIRECIRDVGMYNVKAKRIKEISKLLTEKYGGKVPENYEEILSLPGVGRKTANILFTYAFGKKDYIAVDTHVHKVSNRIGIVNTKTPEKTEQMLYKVIPKREWRYINELFVQHGQNICKARPLCDRCVISRYCDYYTSKARA